MSDEKPLSPQENPFEASSPEAETVPTPKEDSAESEGSESTPDIDEQAFLAELEEADKEDPGDEEGGFFWVFRRIFIEILKVVIILSLIGFVIWLIWGGTKQFGAPKSEKEKPAVTKEVSEVKEDPVAEKKEAKEGEKKSIFRNPFGGDKEKPEKETPKDEPSTVPTDTKSPIDESKAEESTATSTPEDAPDRVPVSLEDFYVVVGDAEFLAFQEYRAGNDLVEQTMGWLRQTRQFSEIGVKEVVQYADPAERGGKIEEKITEGDRLLAQARQLRPALQREIAFWTNKNNQDNAQTKQINDEYKAILQKIEVTKLNEKLEELTQARRQIAESQTYLSAFTSLLKNVDNFERLLKSKVIPVYRPSAPKPAQPAE